MSTNIGAIQNALSTRMLLNAPASYEITKFNRFNFPDAANAYTGKIGYIFFTRPDCNILVNSALNGELAKIPYWTELLASNTGSMIINTLQQTDSPWKPKFMPIISNTVKGYTPVDDALETTDVGETYYGNKITYVLASPKERIGNTITLNFADNKHRALYHTIRAWVHYMELVNFGTVETFEKYKKNLQIDYAASMFYIVTALDGAEILYWEKLVGVFPHTIPDSSFGTQKGDTDHELDMSITFRYMLKCRACDPVILADFNLLSGSKSGVSRYAPASNLALKSHGDPWVGVPFVEKKNGTFWLRWAPTDYQ